jgi:hypothetical protein
MPVSSDGFERTFGELEDYAIRCQDVKAGSAGDMFTRAVTDDYHDAYNVPKEFSVQKKRFVREGVPYLIIGSPELDFIEIEFQDSTVEDVLFNMVISEEESEDLEYEKQLQMVQETDVGIADIQKVLEFARRVPPQQIHKAINSVVLETDALRHSIDQLESGDIATVAITNRIYPFTTPKTSFKEYDTAVQSVINTGQRVAQILADTYQMDLVTPNTLNNIQEDDHLRYFR